MRILFDGRVLTKGEVSGIPEYARLLFTHLLKIDLMNEYILFFNSFSKTTLPVDIKHHANASSLNFHIPNRALDFSFKFLHHPKVDFFTRPDVIFSPHFNVLAKNKKTPRIITFHDLSFERFPEFYSSREKLWHWRQNPKKQAESAEEIIAISNSTKVDLVELYKIPPQKISVVYSGINPFYLLPVLPSQLYSFREERGLPKNFILTLSTLEPRKNIPGLIRAFNILKEKEEYGDFKLIIAGKEGWLCDSIYEEIKKSQWRDDIVLWGPASYEEAKNLYHLASVFVCTSFFEGFGFPPLEAQACGTPVVSSNKGSLPEILERSALLYEPDNEEGIASGIASLIADKELREKIITLGFENVSRFEWEKTAQETLKIFKKYKKESSKVETMEL
ncbi:MAG: glycosyltransferase family 1 protein [Patescibacteria group bacterium]